MGPGVLIDTNILIDHMNGSKRATQELRSHRDGAVSIVSWIELLAGLPEVARPAAENLLENFQLIRISDLIAREAVDVRRASRLKLPDAILLATAHVEKRVLLTRNTKDFREGRFVRFPYVL